MELFEIVAKVLNVDVDSISLESNAKNTPNWSSLRHIELILAIESSFAVQFSIPEIVSLTKLGDVLSLLYSKGAIERPDHPNGRSPLQDVKIA